jgi:hypothetical protein
MITEEEEEEGTAADHMDEEPAPTKQSANRFLSGLRFYLHLVGGEHDALRATIKRYLPAFFRICIHRHHTLTPPARTRVQAWRTRLRALHQQDDARPRLSGA